MPPERLRPTGGRRVPEQQLTFLKPDDAAMLHLLRRFLAEASRLYETRTGQSLAEATLIRHPLDAYNFLRLEMEDLPHEQLYAISLNTRGRVLSTAMIYQGSLNTITLRMAEVFRPAIMDNAASLIVAHNHPSGDPTPSPEDASVTEQL
ncbi:MAG: JAB domain-containing protein, partial [Chloroflexi bacterium]|nr:JAB domain-containing protein [Chloroflexota bacterium]